MNTANKITLFRIFLIPIFIIVILGDWTYSGIAGLLIFIVASLTDKVDGYIARRYNQITVFGKFIDPLADKLLVTSAIFIFVERGQMASWIAIIVLARELAVTSLRLVAVNDKRVIAAGISGKVKTAVSMVAICVMLSKLDAITIIPNIMTVNGIAVAAILVTTIWSGIDYFIKNHDVLDWNT